ncbi:MAG: hypothetical protein K2G13_04510 [Muribaculaceae bacterium]|nr:hypothetical protein [Muribaculaceae bacterium]
MKKNNSHKKHIVRNDHPTDKSEKSDQSVSSGLKAAGAWRRVPATPAIVCTVAFILFCWLMLPVRNGYMLHWYDEMSLFEPTRFFFRQALYFPGGLIRYCGAWLTQLMFYPYLGSAALVILWLLLAWLTTKAFRLSREAAPLSLVVPLAMLVSIVQIDDAWLSMKSIGYIYSNTISYLFTVAAVCLFRPTKNRSMLSFAVLLITVGCYFIAGFYALFAAFIGVILMVADSVRSKRFINLVFPAAVMATILILPNLYYTHFRATTVDNDYLLLKGLPDFLMESFDLYLWIPFIVATASLLVLAVLSALRSVPSSRWMTWVSVTVLCICAIWCFHADKKNEQLRATVVMLHHLENNDWGGMALVMSRIKEPPNYTMRVLNNFAMVNMGGKPEDLKNIKPLNKDPRHAEGFSVTAYVNIPINYYNGDFNLSYRWGMEHNVQYGKRVFFLKYMVKSALLNGEIRLAKKYNDILLGTLFYRDWAKEMNRYIEDPSLIDSNIEFKSILEFANINQNNDKQDATE